MALLRELFGLYLRRADRVVAIGDTMRLRLEEKGAPAGAHARDPELGRHRAARAARQRQPVGAQRRSRQEVRRHALRQRRPRAGPRLARPRGDVPPRPRRPADRDHRHGRAPRGARRAGASCSRSTRCSSSTTSRATCCRSRFRPPTCTSSGSPPGLAGYVVPSRLYGILAVAQAGDRRGRRGERDGAGRRSGSAAASSFRPDGPSCSRARSATRTTASTTSTAMGARGREWVEREADRSVAVRRYRDLLLELAS